MTKPRKRPTMRRRVPLRADPNDADLAYMMGQITTQLALVQQTLSEDRLSSAQYRTEVRAVLNGLTDRLTHVEGSLENQERDFTAMKPKVELLENQALMRRGVTNFFTAVKGMIQLALGFLGATIALFMEKYFFRGP